MILPIEVPCPKCGVQPGVPCKRDGKAIAFGVSYSFHWQREIAATMKTEVASKEVSR